MVSGQGSHVVRCGRGCWCAMQLETASLKRRECWGDTGSPCAGRKRSLPGRPPGAAAWLSRAVCCGYAGIGRRDTEPPPAGTTRPPSSVRPGAVQALTAAFLEKGSQARKIRRNRSVFCCRMSCVPPSCCLEPGDLYEVDFNCLFWHGPSRQAAYRQWFTAHTPQPIRVCQAVHRASRLINFHHDFPAHITPVRPRGATAPVCRRSYER